MPNVLSPRDLVFRPDNMGETVPHTHFSNSVFLLSANDIKMKFCLNICISMEFNVNAFSGKNFSHHGFLGPKCKIQVF